MPAIYLIRHGQACFGKADYDQLSEKGKSQSQLLGKFWQVLPAPDKVFSGDLLRHEQTLKHFFQGYQENNPSTILHSGFNEFNHVDMLSRYDHQWKDFTAMAARYNQQPNANKIFQKEFSLALNRWVSAEHDADYCESWPQFKKRCISALHDVVNQALLLQKSSEGLNPSKNICIFTSSGTISVLVQHILGLSDESTLEIIQQLRNTSVTKLYFSDNKLSIDYLNNYTHLSQAGAEWVTFR